MDAATRSAFRYPALWQERFNSDVYDHLVNPHVAGNGGGVVAAGQGTAWILRVGADRDSGECRGGVCEGVAVAAVPPADRDLTRSGAPSANGGLRKRGDAAVPNRFFPILPILRLQTTPMSYI